MEMLLLVVMLGSKVTFLVNFTGEKSRENKIRRDPTDLVTSVTPNIQLSFDIDDKSIARRSSQSM